MVVVVATVVEMVVVGKGRPDIPRDLSPSICKLRNREEEAAILGHVITHTHQEHDA